MLFVGNQRGGARDLALHLMKDDNERVEVHEIRGFASSDLLSAFRESYAISRATKCKQHLFSLSVNAPPIENASDETFLDAIERAEKHLGLDGQPRAIVFHEKEGRDGQVRRHAHAVWSRIDADEWKAKQLSFTKSKLMKLSRELYLEHDWQMPPGMLHKPDRDPRNFTLEQWQQAKRAGNAPEKIIGIFQDCWSVSDSAASFAHALAEHSYVLAKGRRGFVAVDHEGEVFAVSKWTKKKAKEVRQKLGTLEGLPSVDEAHAQAARMAANRLAELKVEQESKENSKLSALKKENARRDALQRYERQTLLQTQRERRQATARDREERLRKGLLGLLDRVTGKRKSTLEQNAREQRQDYQNDKDKRVAVRSRHSEQQRQADQHRASVSAYFRDVQQELQSDIDRLTPSEEGRKAKAMQTYRSQGERTARRSGRSRDAPGLDR